MAALPPARIRSAPGDCAKCNRHYTDLLEHVRKAHKDHRFVQADFANTHLQVCLCGAVAASLKGLRSHHSRTGCEGAMEAARQASLTTAAEAHGNAGPAQGRQREDSASDFDHEGERLITQEFADFREETPEEIEDPSTWGQGLRVSSESVQSVRLSAESVESTESLEIIETPDRPSAGRSGIPHAPPRPTFPQAAANALEPPPRLQLPPAVRPAAIAPARPPAPASRIPIPSASGRPSMTQYFGFVTMDEAFLALSNLPATYRKLPPHVGNAFEKASEKAAAKFLAQPYSDQAMLEFLCLPKVGLAPGQAENASHRLSVFPDVAFPPPPDRSRSSGTGPSPVKQVEQGKLGNAARILGGQSSIAPPSLDVVEALKSKHPTGPRNPFGSGTGPFSCSPPSAEAMVEALNSFKPDTAPGISGWTVGLLKIAMRSVTVKRMLATLAGMMLAGTAPGRKFLTSSRLIALDKPDGGVRPITVGDLVYRLCAKAIIRGSFKTDFLSPGQFGVGTKGGVEPLIRAVQRAVDGTIEGAEYSHVLSLDFKNAFNTLDRGDLAKAVKRFSPGLWKMAKWAYDESSQLVLSGQGGERHVLKSSQGVRQGDPLGPLLFSIGIRKTLEDLAVYLGPETVVLSYLDDVYILSKSRGTFQDVVTFFSDSRLSLQLNVTKSFSTSVAEIKDTGLAMLGSVIGPSQTRRDFLLEKVEAQEARLEKLVDLPHQHALLILSKCMQQDLRHLQRCLVSDDLVELWQRLDQAIWRVALRIRGSREEVGLDTSALDEAIMSLPARDGGFGLLSHEQCAPLAFAAAAETSDHLLEQLLGPPPSPPKLTDSDNPDSIAPQKARCAELFKTKRNTLLTTLDAQQSKTIIESASGLGRKWLSIIPYYQGLRITDFEVSAGLHLRTLHPGSATVCSLCSAENLAGHAEVCVGRKRWITARHEQVKRAIASCLNRIQGVRVEVEPSIGATNRRNDIRVTGSNDSGLANHEYDVTIVSLFTRDSNETRLLPSLQPTSPAEKSHALITKFLNAVAAKKVNRLPANSVPFSPLVFTVGGMMEAATTKCLKTWQDAMPASAFKSLCNQLSLVLLRARTKTFVL